MGLAGYARRSLFLAFSLSLFLSQIADTRQQAAPLPTHTHIGKPII